MQRRYLWVGLYALLVVTSTISSKVNGLSKSVERLLDVPSYVSKRIKRSAVDFHRSIRCYQPTINVLGSYGNYGCFCGFSGSGYPIDATDKCCQIHDRCYAEAEEVEQTWWEKVVSAAGHIIPNYNSKCENGKVTCEPDSTYRHKLCECDQAASECFHRASATYHPQLLEIDPEKYCGANASYDDLNLTSYQNRYTPLPAITVVDTKNASTESIASFQIKTTSSDLVEKADQNSNSTLQINSTSASETMAQKRVKPTPQNSNATAQSNVSVSSTVLQYPTSATRETASTQKIDETVLPKYTTLPTAVPSRSEKSVDSAPKPKADEDIFYPKLIHPHKTNSNINWTAGDKLERFDDRKETTRTGGRRRKPHQHDRKSSSGKTGHDDEDLDVEILDEKRKENNMSLSALQVSNSNYTEFESLPRLLPSHAHIRTSLGRRNANSPGSASGLRPTFSSLILQVVLMVTVLIYSDYFIFLTDS